MSITTLDALFAGQQQPRQFYKAVTGTLVAGRASSLFYLGGYPSPGAAPTPGIGGEVLTTLTGQIPFTNPVSGNTYLTKFQGQATQAGTLLLCDRLWQNSGIDITLNSKQDFTASAQIPARDRDGTNAGAGVYAAVEVSTVTSTGTPTLTLEYTNQAGSAGKTATNLVATVATSIAGTFHIIGLAAGDTGIQKATALTLSATWTSGTIHVVLFRIIASLPLTGANVPNAVDALMNGGRIYDNSVPFLVFLPQTTTTSNISGEITFSQG